MWAWSQSREGGREEGASLSREELLAGGLAASLQASLLLATLLPVYTLQQGRQLLEYHALPAARILLEWLVAHPAVLRSDLILLLQASHSPLSLQGEGVHLQAPDLAWPGQTPQRGDTPPEGLGGSRGPGPLPST